MGLSTLLVAGPPASGKTVLGAALARRLGATLLDQDVLTQPLTSVIADLLGTDDLDDPRLAGATRFARYEALYAAAVDNLAAGNPVVLVAPFTTERRDPAAWHRIADRLTAASNRSGADHAGAAHSGADGAAAAHFGADRPAASDRSSAGGRGVAAFSGADRSAAADRPADADRAGADRPAPADQSAASRARADPACAAAHFGADRAGGAGRAGAATPTHDRDRRRTEWSAVDGRPLLVWLRVTPSLLRARMEGRGADRDRRKLADLGAFLDRVDLDPPNAPHLAVDAADSPAAQVRAVLAGLDAPEHPHQ
ncbi:hypothetical protein Ais01nite_16510 [Asanoa ishikariensis]|uniref:AAA domain-containing protein n=1 Tax=Asanoa ishikariensis TaxID=137265 RepID=A0A1H3UG97_9ACTN|nr:AAA family ATPase [Asanoa ishikariensis]GIF63616.1 hypothetical protein Ais01nite_16510 [Asanoa ishikariensis]SDZ61307.1 AAA domain-containing protein [Asanoa ishikariensis]